MKFDIKTIFKKVGLSKVEERNFTSEKKDLSEHKKVTDTEKDKRKDSGLVFNSGKNPLKDKAEQVNYRMAKPKSEKKEKKPTQEEDLKKKESKEKDEVKKEGKKKKPEKEKAETKKEGEGKKESIADKLHFKDAWRAPKIIKTNLVKGEITTFIDWKKNLHELGVVCSIAVGIIIFWFIGLTIMGMGIENQGRLLEGDIEILKAQVITAQDEVAEIDKFQEKLKYSKVLMDNHVYWTNFFDFLEDSILPQTMISGDLNLKPTGQYQFSLITDTYKSRNDQITFLRNLELVKSLNSKSASQEEIVDKETEESSNVVSYAIELVLDTKIFQKTKE